MSNTSLGDTSKSAATDNHLTDDLARRAAAKVDAGLHAAGLDPIHLDPHEKGADHTLRPDPAGLRDPIGRHEASPHDYQAGPGPDVGGKVSDVADKARAVAGDAADRAADFADRTRDRASGLADDVRDRLSGAADEARNWVSGVHRDHMRRIDDAVVRGSDKLDRSRTTVEQFVAENPLLVGVVGVAAGLLLGALLPRTRQEDRNIGPYADEVRDQGLRYAREFTSRGREFVETALDPDNIQTAAQKAGFKAEPEHQGDDRTAHRP